MRTVLVTIVMSCVLVGVVLAHSVEPLGKASVSNTLLTVGKSKSSSSESKSSDSDSNSKENSNEGGQSIENVEHNPCDGLLIGILEHPSSCYKYITCYHEAATEETCDEDTIFDVDEITCVPGNQRTCRKAGDEIPIPSDMCRGIILGAMVHPDDCGKYVSCLLGAARERSCRRGSVFSDRLFVCLPGDVNSCTVTQRPSTTTAAPVEIPSDICRQNNVAFGSLPHPQYCTQFISCFLWNSTVRSCGRFQVFSERFSTCMPGNVNTCQPILGRDVHEPHGKQQ